MDMSIYLNGTKLPNFSDFRLLYEENSSDNVTLGGKLYTDFLNLRRVWSCKWELITRAEYNVIRDFYLLQFTSHYYPVLFVPAYTISVPAKLEISESNIKWNGEYTQNFEAKFTEQYAFS